MPPTALDIAGPTTAVATDPRVRYEESPRSHVAYEGRGESRALMTSHRGGEVVVRDPSTGIEGTGPTYLDALREFERNSAE